MIQWLDFRLDSLFGPELIEFAVAGQSELRSRSPIEDCRTQGEESRSGEQESASGEIQETGQVLRSARMVDYAGSDSIRVATHMDVGPAALSINPSRHRGGE